MGIEQLTPSVMRDIRDTAWACDAREDNDDWCGAATEVVGNYLNEHGIGNTQYYSAPGYFGGVSIDSSHTYVVLDDGTIVDPSITQYLVHGAPWQQKKASGYPTLHGVEEVAVIPLNHPFIKKMGYESHYYGLGFTKRPKWVKYNKRAEVVRKAMDAGDGPETPKDLLPEESETRSNPGRTSIVDSWWAR